MDVLPEERENAFGVPSPLALWGEDPSLLSVEPDGLLVVPRDERSLDPLRIVLELKCPNPFDRRPVHGDPRDCHLQQPRMYPTPKLYYLLQVLCECRAYNTPHVLFVCGTPLQCRAWFYTFSEKDFRLLDKGLRFYASLRASAVEWQARARGEHTAQEETNTREETDQLWERFLLGEGEESLSLVDVLKRFRPWGKIQRFWKHLSLLHQHMCHPDHLVMELDVREDASLFVPHCGVSSPEDILRKQ